MENLQRREVKANFRLEFKDYKDFNIHHSKSIFMEQVFYILFYLCPQCFLKYFQMT